jgi:hypothetical protein
MNLNNLLCYEKYLASFLPIRFICHKQFEIFNGTSFLHAINLLFHYKFYFKSNVLCYSHYNIEYLNTAFIFSA